tara:strand:+ start:87 stop:257 length:171 start_codon:yes stop_codon:yes gene_type:complete
MHNNHKEGFEDDKKRGLINKNEVFDCTVEDAFEQSSECLMEDIKNMYWEDVIKGIK